jgi:hypothetical protein
MTETIDSREQQLELSQIIFMAVTRAKEQNELPPNVTIVAALASIAEESGMPDADVQQIGNTVYLSHFSKDWEESSTRAFNMDVAQNFVTNTFEFADNLANAGVKRITVDFKGESIKQMLMMVARIPTAAKYWGLQIFKTKLGGYRAYISLKATKP